MVNRVLSLALLALAVPEFLSAQSTSARVLGTVADPSGAVVPDVRVTATSDATGWTTTAASNSQGQYVLYPLPAGAYTIDFEKSGFQTMHIVGFQLSANDEVVRNVKLEVAATAHSVTVSAPAAMINQTPSVENTVTEDQVQTLPLNGRDYNQLVFLGAGAVDFQVSGTGYGLGTVAANGNRDYSNEYTVDGVPNSFTWKNTSAIGLSVDLIREFKVISGVAPAEYGQGGTNVVVISKGGTNRFHGGLFEYYRGNTFTARNPFTVTPPAPFDRHQFGGSLGGPVRLPRYDGHNRTFFYFNYEGLRQTGSSTRVATVPTEAFWTGDFSSLLPRVQLRDPLATGRPNIPGNRLDTYLGGARISQTALKFKPLFAVPTAPGLANNAVNPVESTSNNNQFTVKVDHLLPHNHSISARVTASNGDGYTPGSMGLPNVGYTQPVSAQNDMLSWTAPLSSTTVNEFRLGLSMSSRHYEYTNTGNPNVDTLGLKGFVPATSNMVPPLPLLQFTGVDAFTYMNYWQANNLGENLMAISNNVFALTEVVSSTRGKHQLKAGFSARRTYMNYLYENNGNGSLTFNGANVARSTGYSFADFLMGLPSSSQQTPLQAKVYLTQPEYAFFAQDDWRLARNFTLTLGVRDEMFNQPVEARNRLALFSPDLQGGGMVVACSDGKMPTAEFPPAIVTKITNAQGNYIIPIACGSSLGYDPRSLLKNRMWNWGPRAGLAWDPTGSGKWLVRSGYGIFFSRFPQQYLALTISQNPPFASLFNYSQSVTNGVASMTLDSPYVAAGTVSINAYGMDKNFQMPSNQQWNLTIQRSLGPNTVISLAYLGNKGTHLFRSVNMNMQQVDPATGNIFRKYQSTFGTSGVAQEFTNANSTYNAMQTELRRRFAHGLAYQINWTWAKGLDDVGAANSSTLDLQNLGRDRANSDYVRRQQINSNFTWELPVGRKGRVGASFPAWLDAAAGGWRLSGIWRYTSGRFLTPSFTNTGSFNMNNRPDVVYGVSPNLPRSERSPQHWFNPAAFAVPPTINPITGMPAYGNAGRNIVTGPGLNNWDGSLSKIFPLRNEARRIVLRMDMFNLLNHANWINPDMNISNVNTVATISGINGSMRQTQFAVEFQF